MSAALTRRAAISAGAGALLAVTLTRPAPASPIPQDAETLAAIRQFAGEAEIREGLVTLEMPALVENGDAAQLSVRVATDPAAPQNFVRRIGVFNEKNPLPNVLVAHLGPRSGRMLATRIRLAASQRVVAVAETSDGRYWAGVADVRVTLAACTAG